MRCSFLMSLLCISLCTAWAQDAEKTKRFDHYLGLQANELMRQLINLNSNNQPVNNPYLFEYSVFLNKYNTGIHAGFGIQYQDIKDKLSPNVPQSKISNTFMRCGVSRRFVIGKKWEAAASADFVIHKLTDKTFSFQVINFIQQIDSTSSYSNSVTSAWGGGAQLCLNYYLSSCILIGTEALFYFLTASVKNNVFLTRTITFINFPDNNSYTESTSNRETEEANFEITVPVAIYLKVKF